MSDAKASETTLRLERLIPSPPEILFALWTEPAQLLRWWGPEGYEPSVDALDTRPGGRWRTTLRRSDGSVLAMSGACRIVEPPRLLVFTWAWEDESGARGHETEVTVSFEARPGGTRLVLLQKRFESKQAHDNHNVGWSSSFDRLTKIAQADTVRGQAMTKPEIIGSLRSTYTRVVCMACEEKGIEYVLTETLLRAPEILAIHPFGKMPVLRHGDFELCESKAIASYLDRSFPGPQLIPSDPRLAGLTEQWVSLVNTVMDGTLIRTYLFAYISPKTADGKPDRKAIEAVTPAVCEQFGILDKAVAKTGYLVDDQFTFADINLLPILYYVRQLPEGAEALAAATHLAGYYERHAARPSFKTTIPPSGPPRRAKPS